MEFYLDKNLILESNCEFKDAQFGIIGVPFDSTSSYRPGSRFGPLWIRKELLELSKPEAYFKKKICDLGNVNTVPGNLEETNRRIEETLQKALKENPDFIPIIIGGEHAISYSPIKVLAEKHKNLQVAHFDAHPDLMDDYLGEKWSHATVMTRVYELGVDIVQFGIRVAEESEKEIMRKLPKKLDPTRPTYVSIDMDILELRAAPGVGTPEPGGFTLQDLLGLLKPIKNLVGFDIVETNPLFDRGDATSVTAGRIITEIVVGRK